MKPKFPTNLYDKKFFSLGRSVTEQVERTVRNGLALTTSDKKALDLRAKATTLRLSRRSTITLSPRDRVVSIDLGDAVKDTMRVSAKSSRQFSNEGDFVMTLDKK